MGIGIIGTGSYLPSKTLTNADLARTLDTSDEWIYSKVGIRERRVAEEAQQTSDLAVEAAKVALFNAGLTPQDLDLIILATSSPDKIQPATAAIVQGRLGAVKATAFDVSAVCSGFVYALTVAHSMMNSIPTYRHALVIGAETYSKIMDWTDRTTCVFFGDGAGAVVLGQQLNGFGLQNFHLTTDGRGSEVIQVPRETSHFYMDGKKVWDFATQACPASIQAVVDKAGIQVKDIDWVITHQANIHIIEKSLGALGLGMEKTYTTIEKYGNTAGASIPITLAEAHRKKLFKPEDNIVIVGFGGGLSTGAAYMKWGLN